MKDETNMDVEEDEEQKTTKVTRRNRKTKKSKKKQKNEYDEQKEFEEFLRDLEEDPEMRSSINMYKDNKTITELETKLAGMTLGEKAQEISNINKLVKKKKIVKAKRKTEKGKELQKENLENDSKTKQYVAATRDDDESEYEDDFPAVNISELMNNLKIDE